MYEFQVARVGRVVRRRNETHVSRDREFFFPEKDEISEMKLIEKGS